MIFATQLFYNDSVAVVFHPIGPSRFLTFFLIFSLFLIFFLFFFTLYQPNHFASINYFQKSYATICWMSYVYF